MNPTPEFLEHCASETGFPPATLEKVIRLGEMAADVGRHPFLGEVLALKGGTALNLSVQEPPRLSVDLDLNYIGAVERQQMLEDRPRVEAAIEELARRRGYRIQRSADAHAGRKIYLRYPSAAGPEDRIEIDLNFLFRRPLGEVQMRELWQPGDLDRPRLRIVSLEEIVAGKLLALLDRTAIRDAYDVMRLPETAGSVLTSNVLRPLFIALSATLDLPLTEYGQARLDRITAEMVEDQLTGMLTRDQTYTSDELRTGAWAVAAPFVNLSDAEIEYVRAVNNKGVLRLELLFADDSILKAQLGEHPALQWKIRNVRRHRGLDT